MDQYIGTKNFYFEMVGWEKIIFFRLRQKTTSHHYETGAKWRGFQTKCLFEVDSDALWALILSKVAIKKIEYRWNTRDMKQYVLYQYRSLSASNWNVHEKDEF